MHGGYMQAQIELDRHADEHCKQSSPRSLNQSSLSEKTSTDEATVRWASQFDAKTKRQLANLKQMAPLDARAIPSELIQSLIDQFPQK